MKINELLEAKKPVANYTPAQIRQKEAQMAKQMQLSWSKHKAALQKYNPKFTIVDFIKQTLPVITQVDPNFGNNYKPSRLTPWASENKLISSALSTALNKTNYWQRRVERKTGMVQSPYNTPQAAPAQAAPAQAAPPAPGTAPMAPRQKPAPQAAPAQAAPTNLSTSGTGTATLAPQQNLGNVTVNPAKPRYRVPAGSAQAAPAQAAPAQAAPAQAAPAQAKPAARPNITINGQTIKSTDPNYDSIAKRAGII